MTYAVPVIDLENVQLEAVRAGTQELGAVQVVNHGVPSGDLWRRMARLLGLPRAEKARLASPHPYRGWRQWPDDFGRLELERFNVAQFDDMAEASAAGVAEEYLGLYAHDNVWPADDPGLRESALAYMAACRGLAERMLGLYGRSLGWARTRSRWGRCRISG
jgi:flavonol synthase